MKKVNIHEKSVKCHEKINIQKSKISFVISQKNLFVPKISKNIFLPEEQQQQGQGQGQEELSLPVLLL